MTASSLALVFAAAAGLTAQEAPPPTPIRWSAQPPATSVVKAGERVTVQIVAVIDAGWHLYALDPIEGGPIPTRITAGPAPAFTLEEKDIDRPEPKRAHDPNFGIETAYYEETATFGLPIAVAAGTPAGQREAEITARFQACNDHICLRPQVSSLRIAFKISR